MAVEGSCTRRSGTVLRASHEALLPSRSNTPQDALGEAKGCYAAPGHPAVTLLLEFPATNWMSIFDQISEQYWTATGKTLGITLGDDSGRPHLGELIGLKYRLTTRDQRTKSHMREFNMEETG